MATKPHVVSLDANRPPITAPQLIAEARRNTTGPGASLEETILSLPETLAFALDQILSDFDYLANKTAPTAVGCRVLAALADHFETQLEVTYE